MEKSSPQAGRRRKKAPAAAPGAAKNSPELQEEIEMLRTIMRWVSDLASQDHPLGELLEILDTLGKTSTRLAGLLKAQHEMGDDNSLAATLSQALAGSLDELRGA